MTSTENPATTNKRTTAPHRRAMAVVATAAVAALLPMDAAQAQTKKHVDPAGDMFGYDYAGGGGGDDATPVAAPEAVNGDVTVWSVTHSTGSVTVRSTFTDLSRTGGGLDLAGTIVTDTGLERGFELDAAPGSWRGRLSVQETDGDRVRCTTSHTTDYAADTVVIKMARACFDEPTWVRAQLVSLALLDGAHVFADDAFCPTAEFENKTAKVHCG